MLRHRLHPVRNLHRLRGLSGQVPTLQGNWTCAEGSLPVTPDSKRVSLRAWCSQCGKQYRAKPCGPTHALLGRFRPGPKGFQPVRKVKGVSQAAFEARFWRNVKKTDTCWLWTGTFAAHGYGQVRRGPARYMAHRASWELNVGPIPAGLHVLHHCDNPPCVNPAHLFLGTHSDNMRDAVKKGRLKPYRFHRPATPADAPQEHK